MGSDVAPRLGEGKEEGGEPDSPGRRICQVHDSLVALRGTHAPPSAAVRPARPRPPPHLAARGPDGGRASDRPAGDAARRIARVVLRELRHPDGPRLGVRRAVQRRALRGAPQRRAAGAGVDEGADRRGLARRARVRRRLGAPDGAHLVSRLEVRARWRVQAHLAAPGRHLRLGLERLHDAGVHDLQARPALGPARQRGGEPDDPGRHDGRAEFRCDLHGGRDQGGRGGVARGAGAGGPGQRSAARAVLRRPALRRARSDRLRRDAARRDAGRAQGVPRPLVSTRPHRRGGLRRHRSGVCGADHPAPVRCLVGDRARARAHRSGRARSGCEPGRRRRRAVAARASRDGGRAAVAVEGRHGVLQSGADAPADGAPDPQPPAREQGARGRLVPLRRRVAQRRRAIGRRHLRHRGSRRRPVGRGGRRRARGGRRPSTSRRW